jgi:hypothetical protein
VIAAAVAYLPWLALDVVVEGFVASILAPRGERRACVRLALAAAMVTHGLASVIYLLLGSSLELHFLLWCELLWAAVDCVMWRRLAQLSRERAFWMAFATNSAAWLAALALVTWFPWGWN